MGHPYNYVTRFDKTRLPHTSNSSTLIASNLTTHYAIALQFHTMLSLLYVITSPNLKLIAHFHTELWSFKVVNLDVCGSLVLSNPVTYNYLLYTNTHQYSVGIY